MRRRFPTCMAVAVLALWLVGCGGDGDGSSGPVAGETVELETVDGDVQIREPGGETSATLEEATEVPVGTVKSQAAKALATLRVDPALVAQVLPAETRAESQELA